MYTQCPECDVAFRVSATVLRQAAGKVRCGGCGVAFNALDHLSEDMPHAAAHMGTDAEHSEPAADPDSQPELKAANPPETISAEHSAALLKTLDQLEGGDVRIEDTGVEWRVLDDDDEDPDDFDDQEAASATGSMSFVLRDDGNDDDIAEIDASGIEVQELNEDRTDIATHEETDDIDSSAAREQMRFDDDTPLPDDFKFDDFPPTSIEIAETIVEPTSAPQETQADVALGEPGEWEDLLDEVVADSPLDMDRQFARQAEAMGVDLSGVNEADDVEVAETSAETETSIDDDLIAAAFEAEAATRTQHFDEDVEIDEFEAAAVEIEASAETLEDDEATDFELPEQTEEEMTINRMIDQDLLALAVEDEDGFTSTMVQLQDVDEDDAPGEATADNLLIETIIMEGDFVRSALESEQAAAVNLEELTFVQQAKETINKAIRGGRRATDPPGYNMIVGAVVLVLVLVLQVVHQSRQAFATASIFEKSIAPIYRIIGKPVTPAWNISAWRFEATKGNTDQDEQLLTIYSRVGNTSDEALPYPLVHVSLTDRFEETIGSRVLEPGEYLIGDVDPSAAVAAGATFHAVISINSPAPDATGFKLNVCYRLRVGELRCAIEDFK